MRQKPIEVYIISKKEKEIQELSEEINDDINNLLLNLFSKSKKK